MSTRNELQALARLRLQEAETLFAAGFYDGCACLCGYVVELALKARICAALGIYEYAEKGRLGETFKTHGFEELRVLAGMEKELAAANKPLGDNWSLATSWKPGSRYEPAGTYDQAGATAILDAIRNKSDGMLECISQRW
ncbi:MAG: HEPN domain-containing protein [Candidatus Acidiferrales bacterium]